MARGHAGRGRTPSSRHRNNTNANPNKNKKAPPGAKPKKPANKKNRRLTNEQKAAHVPKNTAALRNRAAAALSKDETDEEAEEQPEDRDNREAQNLDEDDELSRFLRNYLNLEGLDRYDDDTDDDDDLDWTIPAMWDPAFKVSMRYLYPERFKFNFPLPREPIVAPTSFFAQCEVPLASYKQCLTSLGHMDLCDDSMTLLAQCTRAVH